MVKEKILLHFTVYLYLCVCYKVLYMFLLFSIVLNKYTL